MMHDTARGHVRERVTAVIGLGTMGAAVTRRLLSAGMALHVWDRSPKVALGLAAEGATTFDDARDAVSAAGVVLTWLPTSSAVNEVMLGMAVLEAMAPGSVWAQMGTIGAGATDGLVAEVANRRPDVRFVDAPVSGSRGPAEAGELLVLASGPDDARDALGPVFDAIGRRTAWVGRRAGTGSRLKLALNTWLAFEVEAAAEAASVAERLGVTPDALAAAIEGNPLASPLAQAKLAKMHAGDHQPDFALQWALKDLDLMEDAVGVADAPVAAAIGDRWRGLVERGLGALDVSAARLELGERTLASGNGRSPTSKG